MGGGSISIRGSRFFVYCGQVFHRELFVPFFTWWNWRVTDYDSLRSLLSIGWFALGLSDGMLMFPEARERLPVLVYRWIAGGRVDSLKEVIINEVELGRHHFRL